MTEARKSLIAGRPHKPEWGAQCNGCGVCCMAQTCRIGLAMHGETEGPCPSLSWDGARFNSALVAMDSRVRFLLGIGVGCDSDVGDSDVGDSDGRRDALHGGDDRAADGLSRGFSAVPVPGPVDVRRPPSSLDGGPLPVPPEGVVRTHG